MPRVSIIIRTKNEERWLKHCLALIKEQTQPDVEVIIVDNLSTDGTLAVAERAQVDQIVTITDYRPGLALNAGIRVAKGEYIVCLSAHCLPHDAEWLAQLIKGLEDPQIAGVYGRQIPVAFTSAADKRDLLITFGRDRRRQIKDYFFHNANSVIRRAVWEQIPFDETVTNIEDRLWAKSVVAAGWHLLYEPEAMVYHHHGIHQNNEPARAQKTISVIEQIEEPQETNMLPAVLQPEQSAVVAVIPVPGEPLTVGAHNLLVHAIRGIQATKYIKECVVFGDTPLAEQVASTLGVRYVFRPPQLLAHETTVEEVLQTALQLLEQQQVFPDSLAYLNYLYPFRPLNLFDHLLHDLQYRGLDTAFAGQEDFHNYWVKNATGDYQQIGDGLKPRSTKEPLYQALYGLGTITRADVIRQGKLVGQRVGILPVNGWVHSLRAGEPTADNLINALWQTVDQREHSFS